MLESTKDFVPLDELQSQRLRFVAQLPPFIDRHSIGINEKRLNFLCGISGIKYLRVEAADDSRVSGYELEVCGVDSQGNAYAARKGIKAKVDTFHLDSRVSDGYFLPQKTVNGVIQININEVEGNILKETRWNGEIRNKDAWANHLDRIMREGIFKIGAKHLVMGFTRKDILGTGMYVGPAAIATLESGNFWFSYGVLLFWNTFITPHFFNSRSMEWRASLLLTGPQIDRALLLGIATLGSTLVRKM